MCRCSPPLLLPGGWERLLSYLHFGFPVGVAYTCDVQAPSAPDPSSPFRHRTSFSQFPLSSLPPPKHTLTSSPCPLLYRRYHSRALRSVHFHPTYPLFASSSDDGSIQVFHARVYNDLLTNPLIVPLKILRGHAVRDGLGVFSVRWVPRQPWLVSAGADGQVAVWCSSSG